MPGRLPDHAGRDGQSSVGAGAPTPTGSRSCSSPSIPSGTRLSICAPISPRSTPRIIGLTGSEAQIAEAAKGWNAHYDKFTESDGSITIVHSAHVYLMDADNRLAATLNFQEPEAEQLAKLKALLAGKPAN